MGLATVCCRNSRKRPRQRGGRTGMLQIAINTFVSFSQLLILGLGLGLIYRTTKFWDISFAGSISCACYIVYLFVERLGQIWVLGLFCAFAFTVCLACIIHWLFLKQQWNMADAPLIMLLASLGIYLVLQNL